jgi:hypothetical protein
MHVSIGLFAKIRFLSFLIRSLPVPIDASDAPALVRVANIAVSPCGLDSIP